jgi:hypothetical protein
VRLISADRAFTNRQPFPASARLASNYFIRRTCQQPRPPSSERPGHYLGLGQGSDAQVRDYVSAKCEVAHTSLPISPLKVRHNNPRFTVGMVLAMALTILAVMTWANRDLAAPSWSLLYHPQLLLLY